MNAHGRQKGQTPATRWQWNATVGSLLERPGRQGDWGYVNTEYALYSLNTGKKTEALFQWSWSP